jgi:HK97 gp10 family phage protein
MNDGVTMKLHGIDDVLKTLRVLPSRVESKVTARAVMAGASPILESARANAERIRDTGLLSKSIKARRAKKRRGSALVVIGPTHMKRAFRRTAKGRLRGVGKKAAASRASQGEKLIYRDPGNYGHLVELGHGGPHPAPPKPFLRPAFDARVQESIARIQKKLVDGTLEEIRRVGK